MTFQSDPEDNRENPLEFYTERDLARLYSISATMYDIRRCANNLSYECSWLKTNTKDEAVGKSATEVGRTAAEIVKKMMYQAKMIEGMIDKIKAGRYGETDEGEHVSMEQEGE